MNLHLVQRLLLTRDSNAMSKGPLTFPDLGYIAKTVFRKRGTKFRETGGFGVRRGDVTQRLVDFFLSMQGAQDPPLYAGFVGEYVFLFPIRRMLVESDFSRVDFSGLQ